MTKVESRIGAKVYRSQKVRKSSKPCFRGPKFSSLSLQTSALLVDFPDPGPSTELSRNQRETRPNGPLPWADTQPGASSRLRPLVKTWASQEPAKPAKPVFPEESMELQVSRRNSLITALSRTLRLAQFQAQKVTKQQFRHAPGIQKLARFSSLKVSSLKVLSWFSPYPRCRKSTTALTGWIPGSGMGDLFAKVVMDFRAKALASGVPTILVPCSSNRLFFDQEARYENHKNRDTARISKVR